MKLSKSKDLQDKEELSQKIDDQLQTLNSFFFDNKGKFGGDIKTDLTEKVVAEELDIFLTKANKFLDLIQVKHFKH